MSEKIVIAKELYIGFDDRQNYYRTYDESTKEWVEHRENYQLAFATYKEDNAAFRKRQSTIHGWAKSKVRTFETLENIPVKGIRLAKNVTHGGGWNDLNVFWRIVHPNGFELEISSGNLAKLFQYCTINSGVIQEECVFGFDKSNGSKIVLLPVNSEIYINSVKSTEIHEAKSLKIKDVALGDIITLKNGMAGVYLGKQHILHCAPLDESFRSSYDLPAWKITSTQKYIFRTVKSKAYDTEGNLYSFSTPNIIDIEKTDKPLTKEEAQLNANSDKKFSINTLGNENLGLAFCTSFELPNGVGKFKTIPCDTATIKAKLKELYNAHLEKIAKGDSYYPRSYKLPGYEDGQNLFLIDAQIGASSKFSSPTNYTGTFSSQEVTSCYPRMMYGDKSERITTHNVVIHFIDSVSESEIHWKQNSRNRSTYRLYRDDLTIHADNITNVQEIVVEFDDGSGPKDFSLRTY